MGDLGDLDIAGAREQINDIAGTIHDRIANIREGVRRRYRGDDGPHRLTRGESVGEAEQIDELLGEFFEIIDGLIAHGHLSPEQTSVDGLHRWMIRPQVANIVKVLQSEIGGEPTPASASRAASASLALDGVLHRTDRYVKGIAETLGRPISDRPAPEPE